MNGHFQTMPTALRRWQHATHGVCPAAVAIVPMAKCSHGNRRLDDATIRESGVT